MAPNKLADKTIEPSGPKFGPRVQIDGYWYDISSFVKRHPGGSVIKFYDGLDATDVYQALHHRSKKSNLVLQSLPRERVENLEEKDPVMKDFQTLRQDLIKEGLFNGRPLFEFVRWLEVAFWHVLAMSLAYYGHYVWGGIVYGMVCARGGFLLHELGHRSLFGNMFLDKWGARLLMTLQLGYSAAYWDNQHNKHHAATQEMGLDVDLDMMPVVAVNKMMYSLGGSKAVLRWQWLYFIPIQLLFLPLWKVLHVRHIFRTKHTSEMVMFVIHHIVVTSILWHIGFVGMLVYTVLGYMLGGIYLATVFALNHTHKPVVEKRAERNWVEKSANHTTNTSDTFLNSWFTGYLNYQIEHHLFPNLPQVRLPEVAPRVKALLLKHGLPYDIDTVPNCFRRMISNLREVGNPEH
jgi:fatty acid desaturase